ncbi:MAG: hypothetical protein JRL30_28265 [Deltaproteobacteria bacterium]|nr:hypothetical protein [Deltaproteobacteria bacterium]
MISKNAKRLSLSVACLLAFALIIFQAPAQSLAFEIAIDVAPNTLNIQSQSQVVTVHTSIGYSSVDHDNVYLNGILINSWKADNQGNFVAKFLMEEVKALADSGDLTVPGENILTLVGFTTDGAEFTGSRAITVINIIPAGRK